MSNCFSDLCWQAWELGELDQRYVAPRWVRHWGSLSLITPALVDEIFGDGDQLIYIQPLSTRPNYYVLRVD
jgi:hypothetical protein